MAVKISQLPNSVTVDPANSEIPIVNAGTTDKASPSQIVTAVLPAPGNIGGTTPGNATFVNTTITGIFSLPNDQVQITEGGTGASTAAAARTNLGLGTIATQNAASVAVTGGSVDGTTIGGTTAAAGTFSTMTTAAAVITGGSIKGTSIGATTPSDGAFTTLTTGANTTLSPNNSTVAISPTGLSGLLTINPSAGTMDGVVIGGTTPKAGTFTAFAATSGTVANAPVNSTDIVNKTYADSIAVGLQSKQSCVCATTADIGTMPISTLPIIDGHQTVAGDRVLVKNQTASAYNGIWVAEATGTPWVRSTDMSTWAETINAYTLITSGLTQSGSGWLSQTTAGGTLNTTPITFAQFSAASSYDPTNVNISGGAINGTTIGATTQAAGSFTTAQINTSATVGVSGTTGFFTVAPGARTIDNPVINGPSGVILGTRAVGGVNLPVQPYSTAEPYHFISGGAYPVALYASSLVIAQGWTSPNPSGTYITLSGSSAAGDATVAVSSSATNAGFTTTLHGAGGFNITSDVTNSDTLSIIPGNDTITFNQIAGSADTSIAVVSNDIVFTETAPTNSTVPTGSIGITPSTSGSPLIYSTGSNAFALESGSGFFALESAESGNIPMLMRPGVSGTRQAFQFSNSVNGTPFQFLNNVEVLPSVGSSGNPTSNGVQMFGAVAGSPAAIGTVGVDTDVNLAFITQGAGVYEFTNSGAGNSPYTIYPPNTASPYCYLGTSASITNRVGAGGATFNICNGNNPDSSPSGDFLAITPSVSSGVTISSPTTAYLNLNTGTGGAVRSNTFIRAPIPFGLAFLSSNQTLANATDTVINFTSFFTNTTRVTVSNGTFSNNSGYTLWLLVEYTIGFANNASGARATWIDYGGAVGRYGMMDVGANGGDFNVNTGQQVLVFTSGSSFTIKAWQSSGSAMTIGGASAGMSAGYSVKVSMTTLGANG